MAGCKEDGGDQQKDRPEHHAAEQEQRRRDNGQRQRAENTTTPEAHDPDQAISREQHGFHDHLGDKRPAEPEAEPRPRNVEHHEDKTAEATDLLQHLHAFVFPRIVKPVLASDANTMFGIRMTAMNTRPYPLNQLIAALHPRFFFDYSTSPRVFQYAAAHPYKIVTFFQNLWTFSDFAVIMLSAILARGIL